MNHHIINVHQRKAHALKLVACTLTSFSINSVRNFSIVFSASAQSFFSGWPKAWGLIPTYIHCGSRGFFDIRKSVNCSHQLEVHTSTYRPPRAREVAHQAEQLVDLDPALDVVGVQLPLLVRCPGQAQHCLALRDDCAVREIELR